MSDTAQQQWTIKKLLDWTTDYFSKTQSSTSPRLEAEVLLAETLECERIMLYTRFDEVPPDDKLTQFRTWVKQRGAGEPVAYIVGYREFYSLKFNVSSAVLIPRPETEHIVMAALECAKEFNDTIRILDIGTGSGCIAITLAKHIENSKIGATDLSDAALAVAQSNADLHEVTDKIRFFQGDLLDAIPEGSNPVQMIVSNPPYIGTAELETMDAQVKEHEPEMALFSGVDGRNATERLIAQAPKFLVPGGYLIFESSPIIMDLIVESIEKNEAYESVQVQKDFANLDRVVIAKRAS